MADNVKTSYAISLAQCVWEPDLLRLLEVIRADILMLEKETEGLLSKIIGAESPKVRNKV